MSTNIERLGNALSSRMQSTAEANNRTTVELGTINGNLSLSVDSISTPIPQGDSVVSLHLTHDTYFTYDETNSSRNAPHHHAGGEHDGHTGGTGYHTHDDGLHDHRVPSVFRKLEAGDRVIVAWVGFEPVVIDIVVSGDTITSND